jgi:O-antigen/teichoic acid export membrane protein
VLRDILRSKFARNVAIVATGTAGAQVIGVIFTPIVTRIYGPEAFGVLGTFTAILNILTPMAALSYPIATVLPERDEDAEVLIQASVILAVATALLTALILWVFKAPLVNIFNLQGVEPYLPLLPLSMFFSVLVATATNWILRHKQFKITASVAIWQALLSNLAKVLVGVFYPLASTLIVVSSLATLMHGSMLWRGIGKRKPASLVKKSGTSLGENIRQMRTLLLRHKDFALFRTPQIVVNCVGQSLPVLMIANLFGPAAAGLYVLPKTILGLPTILLGKSVSDVFYPQFVETIRNGGRAGKILMKACGVLLLLAVGAYSIVILFGPWLFAWVFGEQWLTAGEYARWMALWFIAVLASRPIIAAIPALSMQGLFLVFECCTLALRALAIYLGYLFTQSALGAVAAFSLVSVVTFAGLSCFVIRRANRYKTVADMGN